jgi:penicillin-binding protein 1A
VDAWFVGYVPQLATSVWVGYPEERRSMIYVRGFPEVNGENFPLDIWSLYMQEATRDLPVQQLDTPSSDLKLGIKTSGRAYGKLDTKALQKEKQESATKAPAASKEPQKPPINAPPPPIYGRQAAAAASGQSQQPASGQPLPVPPARQTRQSSVYGQPQPATQ